MLNLAWFSSWAITVRRLCFTRRRSDSRGVDHHQYADVYADVLAASISEGIIDDRRSPEAPVMFTGC